MLPTTQKQTYKPLSINIYHTHHQHHVPNATNFKIELKNLKNTQLNVETSYTNNPNLTPLNTTIHKSSKWDKATPNTLKGQPYIPQPYNYKTHTHTQ